MKNIKLFGILLILSISIYGCGRTFDSGGGGGDSPAYFDTTLPDEVLTLEVAHLSSGSYKYIVPLGNLNPSDHTLPTDHIYYVHDDTTETIPVYAPMAGKILEIYTFNYGSEHDNRLIIGVKKNYSYYLIHLVASSSLKVGDTVTTGQQLGVASKHAAAVDIGVLNKNSTRAFINTDHYVTMNLYSDAPLKYYSEPVKTELYSKVRCLGSDKDGKFCYDQAGKLIGGWFHESVTKADISASSAAGTKEVAFVYDNYDPTQILISMGGTVFSKGVYYVQTGATDPANVTTSSGKVTYKLYTGASETGRTGILIVQMTTDSRLKIETFTDTTSDTVDFTSSAYYYMR